MVEYTASTASGYLTDVAYVNIGNKIAIMGHYSTPSNATGFIRTGLQIITWGEVSEADATKNYWATSTGGGGTAGAGFGLNFYFSGHAANATGAFFIIGQ